MSVTRILSPKNRLAGVVGGPKDRTIAELTRAAEANIQAMRPAIIAHVEEKRALISTIVDKSDEDIFAESIILGNAALAICEVAAHADMPATGEAARGIFTMVQALTQKGIWHTEALKLHIDALRLLNVDPPPSEEEATRVLSRLKFMRDCIGIAE